MGRRASLPSVNLRTSYKHTRTVHSSKDQQQLLKKTHKKKTWNDKQLLHFPDHFALSCNKQRGASQVIIC